MHFISTRVHGTLDYIVGLLLIMLPQLFAFRTGGYEEKIPVILGVATIVYSLITRYEFGLFKVLPFRMHLTFDFLSGLLLAASPWLFGFADRVWAPHLGFGLFGIAVAMMTVPHSAHEPLRAVR